MANRLKNPRDPADRRRCLSASNDNPASSNDKPTPIAAPRHLNAREKAIWRETTAFMQECGNYRAVDRPIIESYVSAVVRCEELQAAVRRHGTVVEETDDDGNVRLITNPVLSQLRTELAAMRALAVQVNAGVGNRSRMPIAERGEDTRETSAQSPRKGTALEPSPAASAGWDDVLEDRATIQ